MEIDVIEFGRRIKALREAIPTSTGRPLGQGKFISHIDPNGELSMGQSALSAIELGSGKVARERLEQLAEKAGVEIPYLVNGTGSEALENLAEEEAQEEDVRLVPRKFIPEHAVLVPTNNNKRVSFDPETYTLASCASEIEALPSAIARERVVEYLCRRFIDPKFASKGNDE